MIALLFMLAVIVIGIAMLPRALAVVGGVLPMLAAGLAALVANAPGIVVFAAIVAFTLLLIRAQSTR